MSLYTIGCDHAVAVTKSDSTILTPTQALFVGGAGNVAVVTVGGETVTFTGVIAGSILPVRVVQVLATGTTATNIAAIW